MVKQHFIIYLYIILILVSFILFWESLCLIGEFILVQLEEQRVVVRFVFIVFILGLIAKFILNGFIKCGPLGLYL